jgi:hypothetical protein
MGFGNVKIFYFCINYCVAAMTVLTAAEPVPGSPTDKILTPQLNIAPYRPATYRLTGGAA